MTIYMLCSNIWENYTFLFQYIYSCFNVFLYIVCTGKCSLTNTHKNTDTSIQRDTGTKMCRRHTGACVDKGVHTQTLMQTPSLQHTRVHAHTHKHACQPWRNVRHWGCRSQRCVCSAADGKAPNMGPFYMHLKTCAAAPPIPPAAAGPP